ncbi:MAG: hypothetical protein CL677_03730 [Bdellovibrionaceae bacterium]|nr:hypothetical protein [Pseudobdellovibrionaceae bacterium]|tara:strand:- start:110217 stop:113033 length:2817 start_codon:yes stop_codon:yes gene_type:complete
MMHQRIPYPTAFIVIVSLFFGSLSTFANVVPGDDEYQIIYDGGYRYIFSEQDKNNIYHVIQLNRIFNKEYERSFDWELDEDTSLALASPKNQIANAFATVLPNNLTTYYPSGSLLLERFAERSWAEALTVHETAHLYQLNVKGQLPQYAKTVLGNNLYIPILPPFIWIFTTPNVFLPTFMLEGNATFNESRFGLGGRLYSAPIRARDYAIAKEGHFDETYALNDTLMFPYGQDKYSIGGRFFEFLSRSYPVDQVNQLFKENGERYLNPFLLNKSFERQFGKSFNQLFSEFKADFENEAKQAQVLNRGKLVGWSGFESEMSSTESSILFATNNKYDEVKVHILNKETGEILSSKRDWLFGTPFIYQGSIHTQGSHSQIDKDGVQRVAGLYKKGYLLAKNTAGKLISDVSKNNTLYLKASDGFHPEPELFENGKLLGTTHSRALYSPQGVPFFFRQQNDERILYAREKEVLRFKGRYAKITTFVNKSDPVFIANTKFGSGLFAFIAGKMRRLHPADNIIEAKHIRTKGKRAQFLVKTVTGTGYEYRKLIVPIVDAKQEFPYPLTYPFETLGNKTLDQLLASSEPVQPSDLKVEPYTPWKEMRFNYFLPTVTFTSEEVEDDEDEVETTTIVSLNTRFSDPLERNSLGLAYVYGPRDSHLVGAQYSNNQHRLGWSILGLYSQDEDINNIFEYISAVSLTLDYPLSVNGLWSQTVAAGVNYEDTSYSTNLLSSNYDVSSRLEYLLNYSYSIGISILPAKSFSLNLGSTHFDDTSVGDLITQGTYDLGSENYLRATLAGGYGDRPRVNVNNGSLFSQNFDSVDFSSLSTDVDEDLTHAGLVRLGYLSAINWSHYFNYFPIGLRRFAPFINLQYTMVGNSASSTSDFYKPFYFSEYQVGVSFDLLMFHKFSLPISITYGGNVLSEEDKEALDPSINYSISTQLKF